MSRLIVSNQLTAEIEAGEHAITADYAKMLGLISHRMIWCAEPGDVVVLPTAPDADFARQVWQHLGLSPEPVIVVPPAGERGDDLLYADRFGDPAFLDELRKLVDYHGIDQLYPFYFDELAVRLTRELGLTAATPGFGFQGQGGHQIVNSKAFFRVLAAGLGVDVPDGRVANDAAEAAEFAGELLAAGEVVIIKQDLHGGGFGNEILSPVPDLEALGADQIHHVPDEAALATLLDNSWSRYSQQGRRRVVVEHYVQGSLPIYIEYLITDDAVQPVGSGEVRMKHTDTGSMMIGLVVPSPSASLPAFPRFLDGAAQLGEALRSIGYRGSVSIDAIVTPTGDILFNEINGRVGGSTHVHLLSERIIGPDYLQTRTLVIRSWAQWDSLPETLAAIAANGLAWDPESRTGVLITGDDWQYVVVGTDLDSAAAAEIKLRELLRLDETDD
ncbi:hypothetical protein E1263_03015 [Kribbella antibiotica]|uniref:ATP-grasp domain-containing protein n=1 Tax=Kribbella antibiotica TaxID=190195 RepID=A0A4R4ZZT5_9ACTN|nr:peptide ligase PGM1-related protein [Kribbella antibiotica]TDD62702.1 hypothetical protein E1263_03015 [Kribbella antibiotica]